MSTVQSSYFWKFLCDTFDSCNNYVIPISNKVDNIHTFTFSTLEAYLLIVLDLSKIEERKMICKYKLTIDKSIEYSEGDLIQCI